MHCDLRWDRSSIDELTVSFPSIKQYRYDYTITPTQTEVVHVGVLDTLISVSNGVLE